MEYRDAHSVSINYMANISEFTTMLQKKYGRYNPIANLQYLGKVDGKSAYWSNATSGIIINTAS